MSSITVPWSGLAYRKHLESIEVLELLKASEEFLKEKTLLFTRIQQLVSPFR
jgi:hypothetical protein